MVMPKLNFLAISDHDWYGQRTNVSPSWRSSITLLQEEWSEPHSTSNLLAQSYISPPLPFYNDYSFKYICKVNFPKSFVEG